MYLHYLRVTPGGIRLGLEDIAAGTGERLWSTLLLVFATAGVVSVVRGVARAGREPEAIAGAAGLAALVVGLTSVLSSQYLNPGLQLLAVPVACIAVRNGPNLVQPRHKAALLTAGVVPVVLLGLQLRHQLRYVYPDFNLQSRRTVIDEIDARLGPDGVLLHYGWPTPWAPSFLMRRLVKETGARPPSPGGGLHPVAGIPE